MRGSISRRRGLRVEDSCCSDGFGAQSMLRPVAIASDWSTRTFSAGAATTLAALWTGSPAIGDGPEPTDASERAAYPSFAPALSGDRPSPGGTPARLVVDAWAGG